MKTLNFTDSGVHLVAVGWNHILSASLSPMMLASFMPACVSMISTFSLYIMSTQGQAMQALAGTPPHWREYQKSC